MNELFTKPLTLSREIYPGIHRITLPLPGKKPGPVNVYLFVGDTITLLDTGTSRSVGLLEKALAQLDIDFKDIDRIVLTHGHLDHYGAARKIKQAAKSSVELVAPAEDVRGVEKGSDAPAKSIAYFLKVMGVPPVFNPFMRAVFFVFGFLADNCRVDSVIEDGHCLTMGKYEARVIATPGHTRGSVCLFLENDRILFSGDHILKHITPNALPMLGKKPGLPVRKSQMEFYDSIAKIEALAPLKVYPGHGKSITNLAKTAAMYKRTFKERQERIFLMIRPENETVFVIAKRLFPDIACTLRYPLEIYLAISEVYTHLQVLEDKGRLFLSLENNRLRVRKV